MAFALIDYWPILLFICVASVISFVMIFMPAILARNRIESEKLSPYECGFKPFSNAHHTFDIRFYLVSILFIIFDLEIAFLFPWAITLSKIGKSSFWSMMIFLGILTIGFVYEWRKGALEWE